MKFLYKSVEVQASAIAYEIIIIIKGSRKISPGKFRPTKFAPGIFLPI